MITQEKVPNKLQSPLPCPWCTARIEPICAQPTGEGGEPQTFDNECLMIAEDCGQFERSKNKIKF